MFLLHCNHTGREFIMGSWVNNGYFRIQLTKENTVHQLPVARRLCSVHTVRNNTRSTQSTLKRAVSDNHFMLQHQSHGLTSLWCSCCSRAKPPCSLREREEGVKDELIWQSLHLLKNFYSLVLLMKICFSFWTGCVLRVNKTFAKVMLLYCFLLLLLFWLCTWLP